MGGGIGGPNFKKGRSRAAIFKYICTHYCVGDDERKVNFL